VPNWKVELIAEAHADFKRLDGSVKKQVLKQFLKLEQNSRYGDPLGNKAGINLEGYFKLYVDKKRIRIIYTAIDHIIKSPTTPIGRGLMKPPRRGHCYWESP